MLAENIKPPFAIGLLGDWGVGKSFFMRLIQENITLAAGKHVHLEHGIGAVSRVAQIEFNAWHYVDSDLWASLATHVFDSLAEELSPKRDDLEDVRRELRSKISSSIKEKNEAEAIKDSVKKLRQQTAIELGRKQSEREALAKKFESDRLRQIWDSAIKNNKDPEVIKLKNEVKKVSDTLGINSVMNGVEDLDRTYRSMNELYSRGSGLTASIAADFTGNRAYVSGLVVAVVIGVLVCAPLLLEYLANAGSTLAIFGAPLIQLGAVIGTVVVWAGKNINRISSALGCLEKLRDTIHKSQTDATVPTEGEALLMVKLDKLDDEISEKELSIEEADRRISRAEAELQRISEGGLVYDFLNGRVKDSRYLDRLGLISVIRRDFEKLGEELRSWAKDTNKGETRAIERIVLYIDDLDRCPPKRVVEVLQAVHLLLAFDLFVVVVAVDARWLERALNEAYNPLTETLEGTSQAEHRFNAHNYLEKIFQIPFSMPRMQEEGYRNLIGRMIAEPKIQAEKTKDEIIFDNPNIEGVNDGLVDGNDFKAPAIIEPQSDPQGVPEENPRTPEAEAGKNMEEEPRKEIAQIKNESDELIKKQQKETTVRIESMLLTESEEQFLSGLYCFIDTPRLAKRLLNIYRLIRVRAASIEKDFSTFTDRDSGNYRAVLLLLAISIGRADSAPEILDDLHSAEGHEFTKWLQSRSEPDDNDSFPSELDENESFNLSVEAHENFKEMKGFTQEGYREYKRRNIRIASLKMIRDIRVVSASLKGLKAPAIQDDLVAYKKWAREVGRYSFRWHLKPKA